MNFYSEEEEIDSSLFDQEPVEIQEGLRLLDDKDFCYIDAETARNLELVQNGADSNNKRDSLHGFLNANTATTTGSRMLYDNILSPFNHLETLEHRLDCTDYLVEKPDFLGLISGCIKPFGHNVDLDRLVIVLENLHESRSTTIGTAEKRLETLVTLDSLLQSVGPLVEALSRTEERTLLVFRDELKNPAYQAMAAEINRVIEIEEAQRGYSRKRSKIMRVKKGIEKLFDVARSTFTAAIDDIEQYIKNLIRDDGLLWRLAHTESRGYFLTMNADQLPKGATLPPKYIYVNKNRKQISCTTQELMVSNNRANLSYENSMNMTNEILARLLSSIIDHKQALDSLVNVIGNLDIITCFAKFANTYQGRLVRPTYNCSQTVVMKSKHPVLEAVLGHSNLKVEPNDIALATRHRNFMLVTGPNMGGKSVYLKQVAIIQVMAQIGCRVPAESADIKLMSRIVVRSGSTDDSKSNCSSFMWEMKGIASAIQQEKDSLSESALYIIDEIGRGTTIDDGASYSFAIAEELAMRWNSFTVFATHFDQVFYLTNLYGNVKPFHFEFYEDEDGRLSITHNLVPGFAEKNHYGIKLAQAVGLPEEILKVALSGIDQALY